MSDWQPIESAPRDGRRIRGKHGTVERDTFWLKTFFVPLHDFGEEQTDWNLWNPTLWKPLPEPLVHA